MRILVLADNFVPEQNAPALRTYEHCRRWVQTGAEVTVITTVPNFPTGKPQAPYRNRWRQRETIDGIKVIRVWTFLAANRGVVLRAIDFLSFAISSFIAGLSENADVILATSPQLLTGLSGQLLARMKRRPWVFEVRDLWPESIVAVGALKDGLIVGVLRRLEASLYKSATRIVTLTEPMRVRIAQGSVSLDKIGVVSNGVGQLRLGQRSKSDALAERWGIAGKFIVGYVGTHGMAQGLEVVVRAAEILRDTDIRFLFVGEGARRRELQALASDLKLTNVTFVGMVSADAAVDYLALADVIVVPLRKSSLLEVSMPSKIFEAAAVARPIVLSARGCSADMIQHYDAGLVVAPGDSAALAAAIDRLRADPELVTRLQAGCARLAKDYDRVPLADLMLEELRRAAAVRV